MAEPIASDYLVVFELTGTGFSAFSPDLPGCISSGRTLDEVRKGMAEAISGHLAVMREFGDSLPQATAVAERLRIPA